MNFVEAIILESHPYGEADEILTCLTKGRGKMRFRARGVKKSAAKHRGALQRFNWTQIYFVEGRGLAIITDTILKESFPNIKGNLELAKALEPAVRLIARTLPVEGADYPLWWQLTDYLLTLESKNPSRKNLSLAPTFFTYRLLILHGLKPELKNCLNCRVALADGPSFFSAAAGGGLCLSCARHDPLSAKVSVGARGELTAWSDLSLESFLGRPKLREETAIRQAIERFAQWHLGGTIII